MRTPIYRSRPVEPNPARFGGERVNDFILLSEAFSNSYLLQTDDGAIQVNAGMGMEAPVIKRNFDDFCDDPVRYLILTQGHVDHVGGVAWLREQHPGLQVIAQANNPEHQSYDGRLAPFRAARSAFAMTDKFSNVFQYYAEQGLSDFPPQDVPTPDILFDEVYKFAHGGLELELYGVPGAETNDSLVIWLPQHRICLTGNLFGCPFGHFPNLVTVRGDRYRDALTVAAAVDVVRRLQPEMILYGHHAPVVGADLIAAELEALHAAIQHVHDATVEGMNQGHSVHQLMRDIALPESCEVGQGYGKVAWGVRAIWENYAGWFHHQSTTELYAVPRSQIDADLFELAGSEALLARALRHADAGHNERALHLLDVVLGADPALEDALKLSIRVHESLLADSVNFWLSAWLKQKISEMQGALSDA